MVGDGRVSYKKAGRVYSDVSFARLGRWDKQGSRACLPRPANERLSTVGVFMFSLHAIVGSTLGTWSGPRGLFDTKSVCCLSLHTPRLF